jgi:hypothetical protein
MISIDQIQRLLREIIHAASESFTLVLDRWSFLIAISKIHSYPRRRHMLWTIFAILLILWLLGFSFHVAGSLIHLLLVVAVVVLIINLITGRRAV